MRGVWGESRLIGCPVSHSLQLHQGANRLITEVGVVAAAPHTTPVSPSQATWPPLGHTFVTLTQTGHQAPHTLLHFLDVLERTRKTVEYLEPKYKYKY